MSGNFASFRLAHRAALLLFAVLALTGTVALAQPAVTRDGAVDLVTRSTLGGSLEGIRLWVHPDLQPANDRSFWCQKTLICIGPDGGFVDDRECHPGRGCYEEF